jgi:hydrogenase expression/formation protein HypE
MSGTARHNADASPRIDVGGCPLPHHDREVVTLAHGGGGALTRDLIERVFLPALGNPVLLRREDAGIVEIASEVARGGRLAVSTDCHVVQPLVFPGGSIGELAVHGTVNDLVMVGAAPRFLTAGFVIEEGLPITTLSGLVARMGAAASAAGVAVAVNTVISAANVEHLDALGYASHELRLVQDPGGEHSEVDWRRRFPEAIRWLFH